MTDNRHLRRLNSRFSRDEQNHRRPFNPAVLIAALLALTIQLFVVQTHIHGNGVLPGLGATPGLAANGLNADRAHHPDNFPVQDDPSNCPLCQEFAHSGGYLHSVQIAMLPPSAGIGGISVAFRFSEPRKHISHPWFGRAPPLESARA